MSAVVAEACPCSRNSSGEAWKNHGQYVACVSHALQQLTQQEDYSRREVQATTVEAARSECGKETAAEQTVPVTIAAFYESLEAPAQAGAQVYVDGAQVGETDAAGQLVIDLPVGGDYAIRVVEPALVAGQTQLAVPADATYPYRVDIVMDSEEQLLEPALLVSQDITGPILPVDTSVLRVGFVDDSGGARPLVDKGYVDLVPLKQPDAKREVTGAFTLNAEGALELTDANAFRSALYAMGLSEVALRVSSARDAANRIYGGELRFYVGRYLVTGHLNAPPSNPDLPLAGLTVTATYLPDPVCET
ncbi:hypothetical protein [Thiohalomonas denitrificans]|uniref:hypothetical protein n=1 Tax=Thiohalomonas denitrificans TaxID=415747 RepID=UPI0026EE74D8|nr:hypothetical protein [Thiohalomonas denitrificans]